MSEDAKVATFRCCDNTLAQDMRRGKQLSACAAQLCDLLRRSAALRELLCLRSAVRTELNVALRGAEAAATAAAAATRAAIAHLRITVIGSALRQYALQATVAPAKSSLLTVPG